MSTHLPKPPLPQVQVKLLGRRYATGPDRVKVTHRFLYRPVSSTPADGTISSSSTAVPNLPVSVTIGGLPAQVLYAADAPGLVSGVIQINAVIPQGIVASHHVPVTWAAGIYSSGTGVTIAVNDSPTLPPPVQPLANPLLPTAILFPTHVAADTGSAKISISGPAFTSGMVATWNGQARPTRLVNPTQLQISLSGVDLESPGLGMIAVWDASQTNLIEQPAALVVYLPVMNRDLVYDSLRDKIYVAVAASQEPQGSSIAVLNPETGRIEQWYPLAVEPTRLAVSGDNQYLYVALGNNVQRIDLSSWQPDLTIPLAADPIFGARSVLSMIALPGIDSSLAVSFTVPGLSPPYLGTGIFDGAQMRPTTIKPSFGPNYLAGGPNTGTLYGADDEGNFFTLALTSNGVTIAEQSGLAEGDGDAVYAGGLFYDGWGAVIDPAIPSVVATYDNQGLILPLPDLQKTLILGGIPPPGFSFTQAVLTLHDIAGGARLWSLPLPVSFPSNHGPLIRWRQSGVALREPGVYSSDPATAIDLFRLNLGP